RRVRPLPRIAALVPDEEQERPRARLDRAERLRAVGGRRVAAVVVVALVPLAAREREGDAPFVTAAGVAAHRDGDEGGRAEDEVERALRRRRELDALLAEALRLGVERHLRAGGPAVREVERRRVLVAGLLALEGVERHEVA